MCPLVISSRSVCRTPHRHWDHYSLILSGLTSVYLSIAEQPQVERPEAAIRRSLVEDRWQQNRVKW